MMLRIFYPHWGPSPYSLMIETIAGALKSLAYEPPVTSRRTPS